MKKLLIFLSLVLASSAFAADEPPGLADVRAAAERGEVDAQVELGILYEYGFNRPDHLVPALAWYFIAANVGQPEAIQRRDALIAKLKPAEVEAAKRMAVELLQTPPSVQQSSAPADIATAPAADPQPTPASDQTNSPAPDVTTTPTSATSASEKPLF